MTTPRTAQAAAHWHLQALGVQLGIGHSHCYTRAKYPQGMVDANVIGLGASQAAALSEAAAPLDPDGRFRASRPKRSAWEGASQLTIFPVRRTRYGDTMLSWQRY